MTLLRDSLKDNLQNMFGEEMGGVRGTQAHFSVPAEMYAVFDDPKNLGRTSGPKSS